MRAEFRTVRTIAAGLSVLVVLMVGPVDRASAMQAGIDPGAGPVCMSGRLGSGEAASGPARQESFTVIVLERSVPLLEARGFERISCPADFLASGDQPGGWRDKICRLSGIAGADVQNRLEAQLGIAPNILCANAEAVFGEYQKPVGKGRER